MEEAAESFGDILESIRSMFDRPRVLNEASEKAKAKAKAAKAKLKAKSKAKAKEPGKQKKAAKKGGGSENSPFKHSRGTYSTLGTNTEKKVVRKKKNIWKCSGSEFQQSCEALKDVPSQGIKKGDIKTVKIDPAWKDKYMARYVRLRKTGKIKTPTGKVKPVSFKNYNAQYAHYANKAVKGEND